jgi:hypothetical protein
MRSRSYGRRAFQLQAAERIIQQLQAQMDAQSADQARWIEMMKQQNVQAAAGRGEPEVMQMFQRQFQFAQQQFRSETVGTCKHYRVHRRPFTIW